MRGTVRAVLGGIAAVTLPLAGAFVVAMVTLALLLMSACAPAGGGDSEGSATPTTGDGRFDMGAPGEAIAQVADLTYYPACSNEPLTHDGTTWYPFTPTNAADFPSADPDLKLGETGADGTGASDVWEMVSGGVGVSVGTADAVLASDATVAVVPAGSGVPAGQAPLVAAPEPGQDTGVLTVYEGGLAHWASAFGDLDTWLTDRPIEYMWAC